MNDSTSLIDKPFFYSGFKSIFQRWKRKMNVYLTGSRNSVGTHKVFVQPGNDHDVADWKDSEGKPKLMEIVFHDGKAEVDSNLGEYLLTNKIASRSRLILPND